MSTSISDSGSDSLLVMLVAALSAWISLSRGVMGVSSGVSKGSTGSIPTTRSIQIPLHLLIFLWLSILVGVSEGQRLKQGCVESGGPIRCDYENFQVSSIANLADMQAAEQVCSFLVQEVFPREDEKVIWDVSLHSPYLDSIKQDDPWCPKIRQYYQHCLFCVPDWTQRWQCQDQAKVHICGGKPNKLQILNLSTAEAEIDPNLEMYLQYQTPQDIDMACTALDQASQLQWVKDVPNPVPTTQDFCQQQTLIKHLCPGYCEGTCFDPILHPPTCNGNSSHFNATTTSNHSSASNIIATTTNSIEICKQLSYQAFYTVDIGMVLDVDSHADFLRSIPDDTDQPDSFCRQARDAYADCFWCAEHRCFGDHWPTSCDDNYHHHDDDTVVNDDEAQEQYVCKQLLYAFDNVSFADEMNIDAHKFLIPDHNQFCDQARQYYNKCFWCAPHLNDEWETYNETIQFEFCLPNTACGSPVVLPRDFESITLARMGMRLIDPYLRLPSEQDGDSDSYNEIPCDEIYQHHLENWDDPFSLNRCYDEIFLGRLCPEQFCESQEAEVIDKNYLGATTTIQKRAIIWLSRVSAMLSFGGATYIIVDVLKDPAKRGLVYHQLLVSMALFDIVTAFAWVFATLPIDEEEAGHVEGASGNPATCKAQAFFVQLGFTSVFMNVSLSIYYLLVIVFDWREFQLQKVRIYMHAIPILVGLGLALGGIPIYSWFEYACHLLPPPDGELWVSLVFVVLPLGISIIAITLNMLFVYVKVRQQSASSRKWSLGIGQAGRIERAVFWQCLFYMLAFYVTWPILFSVYLASVDVHGPLRLTLTVAFVAPLQGFNNWLVYIRPKLLKDRHKKRKSQSSPHGSASMRPSIEPSGRTYSSLRNMLKFLPQSVSTRFTTTSSTQFSTPPPATAPVDDLSDLNPSLALAKCGGDRLEPSVEQQPVPPSHHHRRSMTTAAAPLTCELETLPETKRVSVFKSSNTSSNDARSSLRASILNFTGLDAEMLDMSSSSEEADDEEEEKDGALGTRTEMNGGSGSLRDSILNLTRLDAEMLDMSSSSSEVNDVNQEEEKKMDLDSICSSDLESNSGGNELCDKGSGEQANNSIAEGSAEGEPYTVPTGQDRPKPELLAHEHRCTY
ncbi:expressed unknown protein [Seminavis robusta]|uniref:G-protein coupled receptors family 1 profile domain-containing protein n=1 Tax=Seminavis robusta TaxID=568900 RepID=A0A9N8HW87_9STRA|nr:expressed unknown protein [Seminavis robusta]|eukprot:Sro1935_g306390.1 n/a (1129) ;mRNA; r:14903-18478